MVYVCVSEHARFFFFSFPPGSFLTLSDAYTLSRPYIPKVKYVHPMVARLFEKIDLNGKHLWGGGLSDTPHLSLLAIENELDPPPSSHFSHSTFYF